MIVRGHSLLKDPSGLINLSHKWLVVVRQTVFEIENLLPEGLQSCTIYRVLEFFYEQGEKLKRVIVDFFSLGWGTFIEYLI